MLLDVRNMRKRFGKRVVLNDVSIHVDEGEIVGLLGPNGAGKTTLFSIIIGLLRPEGGDALFLGESLLGKPVFTRARMGIGYLSQNPSVFPSLTVRENLEMVLEIKGVKGKAARAARVGEVLERFDIQSLASQSAGSLSGGEQRRLEIARIMMLECRLLLLDEPFSGIDPVTSDDLVHHLDRMKRNGLSILLTDHNLGYSLPVTERSYILHEGAVLAHGTPEALRLDEQVKARYLGERFSS